MSSSRPPRAAALHFIAIALLLGVLVFLFVKTEVGTYKAEMRSLSLLHELRDLDMRWDAEARRLADDLAPEAAATPDFSAVFARIFQEMEQPDARRVLHDTAGALRSGIAEKQAALHAGAERHAQSRKALAAAREALRALAAEVPAAKARNPRAAEALAAIAGNAEHLDAVLGASDIESAADLGRDVERRLATLVPAARLADPAVAGAAAAAEAAAREFVRARAAEAEAWRRFSFLTVGARIGLAARDLSRSIEVTLNEKDRWRVYLVAYAAALLIGLGYLMTRLMAADRALRAANEDLEARVAERTRDLTGTLKRLKESEAQLVQTEKMSSLGQLVAGVAHEINTPLAYVKSNVSSVRDHMPRLRDAIAEARQLLELLRSESPDPEKLQSTFAALSWRLDGLAENGILEELETLSGDGMHGIEQISELVANLRSFSRLDRSRIASFNLNEGVAAAFLIARPMLRKVDVERNLGDIPAITCSPSQVNQVVLNLVTNAAQAIDKPRGRISVTTRLEGSDAVAIEVSDNGKGILPEHMPRLFEPFFTTKEVGRGTGLGLAIAYKIVSQHGGRIDVRSTPGEGSTFTVVLPIEPPPALEASLAQTEEEAS